MERGSSSRRSWADEAEEELPSPRALGYGSPGLDASLFGGQVERLSFSDSDEDYSDSDPASPVPDAKGKSVVGPSRRPRRGRRRRHRRHRSRSAGFMEAARRSHPNNDRESADAPRRPRNAGNSASDNAPRSPPTHPPRARGAPDADGYFTVSSRSRWRCRSPPKKSRPVPPAFVGLCFNCLRNNHVKAACTFPSRCHRCWLEGHRAVRCPIVRRAAKRPRSPPDSVCHGRAPPRGRGRPRPTSADTRSATSASTGRAPSVPHCCAPSPPPRRSPSPHQRRSPSPAMSRPTAPPPQPPPTAGGAEPMAKSSIVIPRSADIQAAENALSLALVAVIGGTRPHVSPAMVIRYLFDRFDIVAERCDVRLHEPEDFIVRFSTPEDRNCVLRSGPGGALLPLIWWPWRRTSLANAASFWYRMLLGLQRVPLHARHADTAQRILGPSCTDVEVVRPADVPPVDDREFFVTAWSLHPQLPHEEVEIFILEPRLPEPVEAATAGPSGLRYLVQIRLVSSEDLGDLQPPPADDGDDNADGGRARRRPRTRWLRLLAHPKTQQ